MTPETLRITLACLKDIETKIAVLEAERAAYRQAIEEGLAEHGPFQTDFARAQRVAYSTVKVLDESRLIKALREHEDRDRYVEYVDPHYELTKAAGDALKRGELVSPHVEIVTTHRLMVKYGDFRPTADKYELEFSL